MNNQSRYIILLQFLPLLLLCSALSCSSVKVSRNEPYQLDQSHSIVLCDSTKAAELIISDNTDDFFGKITRTDICLQMKKNFGPEYGQNDIAGAYLSFLQKDVTNFSSEEMNLMVKIMKEAKKLCDKVSPEVFPTNIQLLKARSRNYGNSVYYTRENCIVIPEYELKNKSYDGLLSVMLHEVFHVYSRLNPEKRVKLYELIGFRHLEHNATLEIPEPLKSQILLNPDGTDIAYYINLKLEDSSEVKAIPIIYSKTPTFDPKQPAFFKYMNFELFEIKPMPRGYAVQINKDGSSTRSLSKSSDFNRQIRDNTRYIIHPDEIMADNFMFLMLREKDAARFDKFSVAGKELIAQLEQVLKSK